MDYSFDPCQSIARLDLNNNDDLKQILRRDKHTRIEGLCSEAVFVDDLLRESFPAYSCGWWFRRQNGVYRVARLVTDVAELSELDFKILSMFARHVATTIIQFDLISKACYGARFDPETRSTLNGNWFNIRRPVSRMAASPRLPGSGIRDAARLEQAIQLLESRNRLQHAAIERLFANCWLGEAPVWDVDFFVEHNEQLIAFEVKQKYPTRKGTFGLNVGEARLLTFLAELGIVPVHVILTKPVSDETVPAIDLYSQDRYKSLSLWIAARFSQTLLSSKLAQAPGKTSIYGAQRLNYYDMELRHFHRLKTYGSGSSTALLDFLAGKTRSLKGVADIPIAR